MKIAYAMGLWLFVPLLVACSHPADPAVDNTPKATANDLLVPPSRAEDLPAWRAFAGKVILAETHEADTHPYSFIVPPGDAMVAVEERRNISSVIHSLLDQTAVPGNMIVVTGADPQRTAEVLAAAFHDVRARSVPQLTVLYIGSAAGAEKVRNAVHAAGADLRLHVLGRVKG
jgi:hypothetical protein